MTWREIATRLAETDRFRLHQALLDAEAHPDLRLVSHLVQLRDWGTVHNRTVERRADHIARNLVGQFAAAWQTTHPHLYCTMCQARTNWHGPHWLRYVACRTCGDTAHLAGPVQTVVARLGAPPPHYHVPGLMYVSAWDDAQRTAMAAELDLLEIFPHPELPVDWALAALLHLWLEQAPGYRMPVVQLMAPMTLQPNTIRLLTDAAIELIGPDGLKAS